MIFETRRKFLQTMAGAAIVCPVSSVLCEDRGAAAPVSKIRIGQIGVSHAHAGKLDVYRRSPDYEVVGIVEPDAKLREIAEQQPAFKDLTWMTQEQLLNVPELQVVLIETEVKDLLDHAEVCIQAGKHIHLDKPAGQSLPQLRRIQTLAAKQRLMIQLGYMYRYNPGYLLLRELLNEGWLGEIFEVHAVMNKFVDPESRRRLAYFSGGIMFELGGHVIDPIIGALGSPERVTGYNRHVSVIDDGLLDNMLAVLEYSRALVTVKCAAVEIDGGARRHLTVCGSEGTLHIQPLDNPSARLTLSRARGPYRAGSQEVKLPKYERYVEDAAEMARCLRGEKNFEYSYAHDLAVQTALLTACEMPLDR